MRRILEGVSRILEGVHKILVGVSRILEGYVAFWTGFMLKIGGVCTLTCTPPLQEDEEGTDA